ncbi:UDP-N-acetylmuramoyl-L-alanyl-D-glutamate--2,6-diaminopimelate ligase [Microvirga sp. 3-52]|uniref:UDP-N-acetylmuramoyl-L-alanyl-D-glutamate--2, 6-diaminopimelate ligase n=1 Tax=Microvirga sp. 3-52 TaxID=2792425 RepID=UPI001AD18B00|nr:UDP-N-acetylmuramoyl-L-alanyl-D-glutamate--2,6-diaminopimelate ligase [Microvirga sp. 3-52]MBO1903491.1 UDP-N-acetylmuramoyl-L-alanyl-D-glutamate--2,6-diaminopimelate ligase [Microvirga sp. 3-52]MBS7450911.1 UDP-N-acetylmuramoyl-L-alanyl-D-glutamate--2,6-diaminopimelate ligase [Microvirga sp. 3-52]
MSARSMPLGDLMPEAQGHEDAPPVSKIASDSRKVERGTLFFAVPGTKVDGMSFVPQAVAAGAVAVAGEAERPSDLPGHVAYVQVGDVRRALALAAARFYPKQPEKVVAVTGTSGKSSVADFTRQLFAHLGYKSASVGTLGIITSDGAAYGSLTTPDPISLHESFDRLANDGITRLAMEASSHGIDQRRLDGVRLQAAGFTNLGRDHLDYHATTEAYAKAKMRLFDTLLPGDAPAIINADGPYADVFLNGVRNRGLKLFTTGRMGETLHLVEARAEGFTQALTVEAFGKTVRTTLPLLGAFQVENALVAAGLVLAVEGEGRAAEVLEGFMTLKGVSGRLEQVGEVDGAICIVDYAHKPDALAHVLDALRPFVKGRLVCVVGCGGDRDRGKRPLMGRIASDKADLVIVTDDNPRSEDPAAIRAEVMTGAPGAREIGDRAEAIRTAVKELREGDILVVAGKGHETGQIIGDRTLPFSDHDEVRAAIAERQG